MPPQTPPAAPVTTSEAGERLVSLDALRGFDMIWILGADAVVKALALVTNLSPLRGLAAQMEHKVWSGFAFYDLIFPLFLFISGVAMVFSLPKTMARSGRAAALRRILIRAVILFGLGVLYNGGLAEVWPHVRIAGVLQRIALAYVATGVLFCFCRPRTLYIIGAALLLGYWALLAWIPVRDITLTKEAMAAALGETKPSAAAVRQLFDSTSTWVTGRYERGLNLANHVDYQWLPGAKYRTYWDPEGLLSTLPAIATCLLGVMAGHRLRRPDRTPRQNLRWLAAAGGLCLATGWLWHGVFPVVKDLWSSSFVLVAGGWSLGLLAVFYYVVDVRLWRGWCQPFVWVGLNPITLYLATSLVDFWGIARRLVGGSVAAWLDSLAPGGGELGLAVVSLVMLLTLARFLHQRRIYLRV